MFNDLAYQTVFQSVSDTILVLSEEGRALDCNPAALELFRCTRDELIGTTFNEWSPEFQPDGRRSDVAIAEMMMTALRGEAMRFDWTLRRRDGIPVVISTTLSLLMKDSPPRLVLVSKDISLAKITERRLADEAAQESRERYRALSEASSEAIFISEHGICLEQNQQAEQMFGYPLVEAIGRTGTEWIAPESRDLVLENMLTGCEQAYEVLCLRKDGSTFPGLMRSRMMHYLKRHVRVTTISDISAIRRAEVALRESEATFRKLFEDSSDAILLLDSRGVFVECNQAGLDLLKMTREQFLCLSPAKISPEFQPDGRRSDEAALEMIALAYSKGLHRFDWTCVNSDGGQFIVEVSLMPVVIRGQTMLHTTWRDITERKAAAEKIEQLAFYDPLTALPNRRLLSDRLEQAITSSARHHRYCALMLLDMDDFKGLNDTMGHDVGDQFLVEVARRLESMVREGDTVARHGGDEFVVILEDLSDDAIAPMQAEQVAVKILKAVSEPYVLKLRDKQGEMTERSYYCTSSIGITLFRGNALSTDELLRRADTAMYQAKAAGRNSLRFFDPEMQAAVEARTALDGDLREAILGNQFELYYQAQVNGEGQLTGAEALLRWSHAQRGKVSPVDFIPLAEASGMILPLGHWVLQMACAQLARWASDPHKAHLTLAVNVSARQLKMPNFVEEVLAIVAHHGANPHRLKLELTESLLVEDIDDVIDKMSALKREGVSFSLDDFGTGYSSLSYLKRLPLDQLKIDRSFVRDVLTDPNDATIACTIVALARSLGINVIAEGVETEAQREFLAANGCHAYQGYLFGRPVSIDQLQCGKAHHATIQSNATPRSLAAI